ncbi:MAG TPA: hypothetical protein VMC81_10010 [Rhodocyclaceae bacterium]|nr:hypothetical protein [Rhodocyclaceae bacterium]
MPIDPITAAIVGSVINNALGEIANAPPPVASVPIEGVPRVLPEGTIKGEMIVGSPTSAMVNGRPMVLAPGVQIRDPYNMTVLPGMIGQPVLVRYQTDVSGAISRVWILSQQEAAQP